MMPPGHLAVTWGMAALCQQNKSQLSRLDYRLLAVAALGADLIDKPLGMFVFTEAHTSQLIAHSLVVNVMIVVLALLLWRQALPYALAFTGHLWLDRMWHHPESFWWPFFGWNRFWAYKFMGSPEAMVSVYLDILRYPQVWVVEVAALLYLTWFIYYHRLYQWPVGAVFLQTGRLPRMKGESSASTQNYSSLTRSPRSTGPGCH